MKTRSIPSSIAPIVEELELRQPSIVTRSLLKEVISLAQPRLTVDPVAERLVRLGWLLPLRSRNAWEFAPGSRAGAFGAGDPWIELRALLEHHPESPVAVAFESAVWELGHSFHQPQSAVIAHRPGWRPPKALDARAVGFDWRVAPRSVRGLPVLTEASTLVAAAVRPSAQGNWANGDDWLPGTFRAARVDEVIAEARGRSVTALARLGYLAEWADRNDIAAEIEKMLPSRLPVTFLGPRDSRKRWNQRWRVYDANLPAR